MRTSLSPENRIDKALLELGCSGKPFVSIAKEHGIAVSNGNFSEVMSGKRDFEHSTADRLLSLVDEMKRLQDSIPVPINWYDAHKISEVLTVRRIASVAAETGDSSFDEAAIAATKSVAK